jgi:nitroimidazol reductase NimA-like FMN-containing flavoprotein (pyridoxamine 5'-phosphate oxidase superfamily)
MRTRTISDKKEIGEIIRQCQWCHLGMADTDGSPYVLPMNFGFRDDVIYLHGAQHGKKIEILKRNPRVCIQFSTGHELRYQSEQVACSWSMRYRSVICYGTVQFLSDPDEKVKALDIIMSQYADRDFRYNDPSIREVNVFFVKVERFEGRAFGK